MRDAPDVADQLPLAEELVAVFARMAGLVFSEETTGSALRLVTSLASEVLPGTTGAGVTLLDGQGKPVTAASTDAVVKRADELQYELGEGPCLTAWEQRTTVRVTDALREKRWPRWSAAMGNTGVRSSLSAPLVAGDVGLGALKVYSSEADSYGPASEHVLQMFAAQAASLVANVQAAEKARHLSDDLKSAVRSRDVISLAKGIIMEREHVSEDDAFWILVGRARSERLGLHVVAENLARSSTRRRRRR